MHPNTLKAYVETLKLTTHIAFPDDPRTLVPTIAEVVRLGAEQTQGRSKVDASAELLKAATDTGFEAYQGSKDITSEGYQAYLATRKWSEISAMPPSYPDACKILGGTPQPQSHPMNHHGSTFEFRRTESFLTVTGPNHIPVSAEIPDNALALRWQRNPFQSARFSPDPYDSLDN
ncbi:MAG: hypothetical protein Q9173_006621 [Seirophora scorigena]